MFEDRSPISPKGHKTMTKLSNITYIAIVCGESMQKLRSREKWRLEIRARIFSKRDFLSIASRSTFVLAKSQAHSAPPNPIIHRVFSGLSVACAHISFTINLTIN
jgi:hypothetical protein